MAQMLDRAVDLALLWNNPLPAFEESGVHYSANHRGDHDGGTCATLHCPLQENLRKEQMYRQWDEHRGEENDVKALDRIEYKQWAWWNQIERSEVDELAGWGGFATLQDELRTFNEGLRGTHPVSAADFINGFDPFREEHMMDAAPSDASDGDGEASGPYTTVRSRLWGCRKITLLPTDRETEGLASEHDGPQACECEIVHLVKRPMGAQGGLDRAGTTRFSAGGGDGGDDVYLTAKTHKTFSAVPMEKGQCLIAKTLSAPTVSNAASSVEELVRSPRFHQAFQAFRRHRARNKQAAQLEDFFKFLLWVNAYPDSGWGMLIPRDVADGGDSQRMPQLALLRNPNRVDGAVQEEDPSESAPAARHWSHLVGYTLFALRQMPGASEGALLYLRLVHDRAGHAERLERGDVYPQAAWAEIQGGGRGGGAWTTVPGNNGGWTTMPGNNERWTTWATGLLY